MFRNNRRKLIENVMEGKMTESGFFWSNPRIFEHFLCMNRDIWLLNHFQKGEKLIQYSKTKGNMQRRMGGGQNPLRKINPIHLLTEKTKGANNEN
jgi:hypothetical protein